MLERKTAAIAALVATTGAVAAGVAAATPWTGVVSAAILARGTPDNELKLKLMLLRSRPGEVAVQQVTLAPGGSTGWHSHPGPAVVIVKSGSFTLYDGDDRSCTGTTCSVTPEDPVGKAFVDEGRGHVHIGRNEGATNTELYVTYFGVPAAVATGPSLRRRDRTTASTTLLPPVKSGNISPRPGSSAAAHRA
jgi:quercetin dioxygenase-like cupin family protein